MTDRAGMNFVERHGLWSDEQRKAAEEVDGRIKSEELEVVRFSFPDQRINAPAAGAVEENEQEEPAIEDRQLAFVRNFWSGARDWEKRGHWR